MSPNRGSYLAWGCRSSCMPLCLHFLSFSISIRLTLRQDVVALVQKRLNEQYGTDSVQRETLFYVRYIETMTVYCNLMLIELYYYLLQP